MTGGKHLPLGTDLRGHQKLNNQDKNDTSLQCFLKITINAKKKKKSVMNQVETGAKEGRKFWEGKKGLGLGVTKAPRQLTGQHQAFPQA